MLKECKNFLKIITPGLCIGILVIPQLFTNQMSVAFDALAWIVAVVIAGGIFRILFSRTAHISILLLISGALIFGVGLSEFGVIMLWLLSSWSIGALVLGRLYQSKDLSLICTTEALIVGALTWVATWGVMLHFTVNYQVLHIALSLLPPFLLINRLSEIHEHFLNKKHILVEWMRSIPFGAWIVGLAIVSWVLRWSNFPSMGFDDHANHLRIWTELLTLHHYSFDVSTQIWSVAPFTVNLLHAGLSLMAGGDARSAMNLTLAISSLLLMAGILQTWKLSALTQWLLMVLMATTPMLGNLLLSLQTELLLSVLALAGMRLVIVANGGWRRQHLLGVLSCSALCASIKLPGAVLGVTLLAGLVVHCWTQREIKTPNGHKLSWSALLLVIPLCFVALHSYGVAWKLTGNPVFPLYNAIFLSPYFDPVNFSDSRWIHGFSISSYVRAFFHTSEFFESGDYTAGWQYLIMLPIGMISLLRSGTPGGMRILLIPILGFGLVMFSVTQYWRYLYPVMPLAVVLLGSLFIQRNVALRKIAFILALVCIVANFLFFTRVTWMMNSPAWMAFTLAGKETLTSVYAPASLLTERVNILAPGSRVLYPSNSPYGAKLHGIPLYLNWYQPFRDKAFNSVKDFDGLTDFISKEKIDFAILMMSVQSDDRDTLLREYMSQYGHVEGQSNNFLLYKIGDKPVHYKKIFDLKKSESMQMEKIDLLLPLGEQGVIAPTVGTVLAAISTHQAKQARYKVEFTCPSNTGYFVAQINWDKGAPYYRLVACDMKGVTFVEAIPVPIGSTQGSIYVTSRDTSSIQVRNLMVELN